MVEGLLCGLHLFQIFMFLSGGTVAEVRRNEIFNWKGDKVAEIYGDVDSSTYIWFILIKSCP